MEKNDLYTKGAAVVTGASSGIGLAISEMLIKEGYIVYGIGRDFSNAFEDVSFIKITCDLLHTDEIIKQVKIINKNNNVILLVNNAGCAYYGLHEELSADNISRMVRTNIEVPMILSNCLLRTLKKNQGTIINISSVTANNSNPHGCAYGATKAALSSFSRSLFDEARKYGVKVVAIQPDMTATNLYRNANFKEADDIDAHLIPQDIADAVKYVINRDEHMVISQLTIQPQKHKIQKNKKIEN